MENRFSPPHVVWDIFPLILGSEKLGAHRWLPLHRKCVFWEGDARGGGLSFPAPPPSSELQLLCPLQVNIYPCTWFFQHSVNIQREEEGSRLVVCSGSKEMVFKVGWPGRKSESGGAEGMEVNAFISHRERLQPLSASPKPQKLSAKGLCPSGLQSCGKLGRILDTHLINIST